MILDNIPEYAAEEMKKRLMMEGVFNRDSEITTLRIRLKELAEHCGTIFSKLRYPLMALDTDGEVDISKMVGRAEEYGLPNFRKIHQELYDLHTEMDNISKEMKELLDERANR